MKQLQLTQGKVALIDDEDFLRLSRFKWRAWRDGARWYASRSHRGEDGKEHSVLMHRYLLGAPDGVLVDHADGDPLNNQKSNLRLCSVKENNRNACRPSHNSSGLKGVSWHTRAQKWRAQISMDGKRKFLGYFEDKYSAFSAYCEAAKLFYGEFSRFN